MNYQGYYAIIIERKVRFFWILLIYILEVKMINEIAEKIRNLRKEKNLTLKDLSEKTGLSISFLSQVENNSSSLAITSLKKLQMR